MHYSLHYRGSNDALLTALLNRGSNHTLLTALLNRGSNDALHYSPEEMSVQSILCAHILFLLS